MPVSVITVTNQIMDNMASSVQRKAYLNDKQADLCTAVFNFHFQILKRIYFLCIKAESIPNTGPDIWSTFILKVIM